MLDRKTHDRKSQLPYRFHASAKCEYHRLPSYFKHYFIGQFLHKMTFLMLLGWKYPHAFIQSHVADKTSPYWILLCLLTLSLPSSSSRDFRLLPSLVSPLPQQTCLFDGSSLSCSHPEELELFSCHIHACNYVVQITDSCRVTPCLKPRLSLVLSLIYQVVWGPLQTKTLLHSSGLRAGPTGAHWVMTVEYPGALNSLGTQTVKGRSFKDTTETDR